MIGECFSPSSPEKRWVAVGPDCFTCLSESDHSVRAGEADDETLPSGGEKGEEERETRR
ncbi:Protein SopB [Clarias magur]|uniref:Protein SopB n=1 Tax=Clarias magur TaxID=1594786 RepID=A0A8J4U2F5_CLAMG|nr:Protein SopB [Clarias magur]